MGFTEVPSPTLMRMLASSAAFAVLNLLLLSGVQRFWWVSDLSNWFTPGVAIPAHLGIYILCSALVGAVTLLIQKLSPSSAGVGALVAALAWIIGGVFLYAPALLPSGSLPNLQWWTTDFNRHGEVGGSVYSGWFIIGGCIMGLIFGTLTSFRLPVNRYRRGWWVALAALAGALGWGIVPAGAWIT